ncbi:MAG: alpha/beta-type small acid-soluble spore protein [Firmicutes bacterium]|nr:alpha/beta-type small acid-soluble spore protein [Bacillota bacterium]
MGTGQKRNNYVVQAAANALHNFKYEISKELNIDTSPIVGDYWGYMTSRDCGAVGGNMVRRMIEAAERSIAEQALTNVQAGFKAGLQASGMSQNQQDKVPTINNLNLNNLDKTF